MQRILAPARVIFMPIAVYRLTGIWSRASRVFVPFGLLPVSVGCPGGRYRCKPRAAGSGLPATCLGDLCQPPACVSIALAHRYAVRLLVGWSCPRQYSLDFVVVRGIMEPTRAAITCRCGRSHTRFCVDRKPLPFRWRLFLYVSEDTEDNHRQKVQQCDHF